MKEILLSAATKSDALNGAVATGGMLDLGNALTFDLNRLSGEKWEEKTPYVYKGNAPQITAQIVNRRNKSYLSVQFHDEDGDIITAKYADGELTAQDFNGEKNTNAVNLTGSGVVTYEASAGTYTFYALDAKGNETVKVVKITETKNRQNGGGWQSGMPGFGYGIPNPADLWFEEIMGISFDAIFDYIRQFR